MGPGSQPARFIAPALPRWAPSSRGAQMGLLSSWRKQRPIWGQMFDALEFHAFDFSMLPECVDVVRMFFDAVSSIVLEFLANHEIQAKYLNHRK